jgi:hypothetical protein
MLSAPHYIRVRRGASGRLETLGEVEHAGRGQVCEVLERDVAIEVRVDELLDQREPSLIRAKPRLFRSYRLIGTFRMIVSRGARGAHSWLFAMK